MSENIPSVIDDINNHSKYSKLLSNQFIDEFIEKKSPDLTIEKNTILVIAYQIIFSYSIRCSWFGFHSAYDIYNMKRNIYIDILYVHDSNVYISLFYSLFHWLIGKFYNNKIIARIPIDDSDFHYSIDLNHYKIPTYLQMIFHQIDEFIQHIDSHKKINADRSIYMIISSISKFASKYFKETITLNMPDSEIYSSKVITFVFIFVNEFLSKIVLIYANTDNNIFS